MLAMAACAPSATQSRTTRAATVAPAPQTAPPEPDEVEPGMKRDRFWSIIANARTNNPDAPQEGLRAILRTLSPEEIVKFQDTFDRVVHDDGYQWGLWGAAYLINGGCSDDCFEYFRYALVSLGEHTYQTAIQNPDSLADVNADFENEAFGSVASEVYADKTGREIPLRLSGTVEPLGEGWNFDNDSENRARLPRLFQKVRREH